MVNRASILQPRPSSWTDEVSTGFAMAAKSPSVAADCFYSTVWVEAERPSGESSTGTHLLLSGSAVDVDLPHPWVSRVVLDANSLGDVLVEQVWGCVAVLSDGRESDVMLGLGVLQACLGKAIFSPRRIVFLLMPGAADDAGLRGLARTVRLERPDLAVHCIEASRGQLSRALTLSRRCGFEDEYRFTETGVVEVPRLRRHVLGDEEFAARPSVTYVVSGGLSGLGLVAAEFLVERGARHLALLSPPNRMDSDLPPKIFDLRRSARVEWVTCDLSDPGSVRQARDDMDQAGMPAVAGVIHAADIRPDGLLANQSESKLKQAYGLKVGGAKNLLSVLYPLDFVVLFSSTASTFGFAGQASFAAANATLDALAESWSSRGEPVLSIQWGAWSDTGVPARHDADGSAAASTFGTINNELASIALSRLLAGPDRGTVCVSSIDWPKLPLRNQFVSRFTTQEADDSWAHVLPHKIAVQNRSGETGSSPQNPVSQRPTTVSTASSSPLPVLIIGAGLGGVGFARKLEKLGVATIVLERRDSIGGVWSSLANMHSRVQIDSPAYSFDSASPLATGDHRWRTVFPGRNEVLQQAAAVSSELKEPIHFNCEVVFIRKVGEREYEADYRQAGVTRSVRVSGVAALTGGLHHPVEHQFTDEHLFLGHVGMGIADDTPPEKFNDASVVIVGHGAFAIENMRTALENGARHVTIICRRRNLVVSTLCNWMINSIHGATPVNDVVDIMRPFYDLCGIDIESLPTLSQEIDGTFVLDQSTVPAASDVYFLAQALGKVTVIEDEIASLAARSVSTRRGMEVEANVLLKCLGSHTDQAGLLKIFGEDSRVEGLWVNGDPNLFTYNDSAQIPRKAKSLLCSSFVFFLQAFAEAYLHFRDNPSELRALFDRIAPETVERSYSERLLVELWEFIQRAKRNVASRTVELCPFDRFQEEREAEWRAYSDLLGGRVVKGEGLWGLMSPTISLLQWREPALPMERRVKLDNFGLISIFAPRRHRVLFLQGIGTDGRLARAMLKRAGWTGRHDFEFVIPDAPYAMPALTDPEQLEVLGLDSLVDEGMYDFEKTYRAWNAGFSELWNEHRGVCAGAAFADPETMPLRLS
jgi:NAD(P)-dependent dehydrogenase (short-subunit alcohol dehydrogenase family)